MHRDNAAMIDFTEAAYNLELDRSEWLRQLLKAGAPFIDHGLGIAGIVCRRDAAESKFEISQVHIESCPDDFLVDLAVANHTASQEFLWKLSRPNVPMTASEAAADDLEDFEELVKGFADAKDGLGLSAFDPDGNGVYLVAPLSKRTSLTSRDRDRWQMVAAHFGAGHRLRRAIEAQKEATTPLPHDAEAILDPHNFRVTDAVATAGNSEAVSRLRDAAKQVDRARGRLRTQDPQTALELWNALVRGRWSMVDWFDSDDRRFMLAIPNDPTVDDPRGLTKQEAQVVSFVASGHSNKLIEYQLGLSKARVSDLITAAKRKLGVRTRAQLIRKWSDFAISASRAAEQPPTN